MQELMNEFEVKYIKVHLKETFVIATYSYNFHKSVILKITANSTTERFGNVFPGKQFYSRLLKIHTILSTGILKINSRNKHFTQAQYYEKPLKLNSLKSIKNTVDIVLSR